MLDKIPLLRNVASIAIGPAYVGLLLKRVGGVPVRAVAAVGITTRMGAIFKALESDSGVCGDIEPEEELPEEPEIIPGDMESLGLADDEDDEIELEDLFTALRTGQVPSLFPGLPLREGLRGFIKETIYAAYPSLRKIEPQEYLQYSPACPEEAEDDEKDDVDTNDFAVAYKTDSGVITAHPRALKESDIRVLIRQVLDEAKKKKKSKKVLVDDEIGEASSVSSGGGGPVTPLGTGPKGRSLSRKTYIDQVNKNASFYGGSLVNPQDPALIYTAAEKWAKGIAEKSTSKRKKKKKN